MNIYNSIVIGCWVAFVLVWIATGFRAKRTLSRNLLKGWGLRFSLLVAAILAFGNTKNFRPIEYQQSLPATWGIVGVVCAVAGIGLAIWARIYLGRNWGMPMSVKENPELVTKGPYALIRHPIYTGMLLAMLGSTIVAGPWWLIVAVVSGGYFIYSSYQEDKLMLKEFPSQYPAYKARTWRLVPWLF